MRHKKFAIFMLACSVLMTSIPVFAAPVNNTTTTVTVDIQNEATESLKEQVIEFLDGFDPESNILESGFEKTETHSIEDLRAGDVITIRELTYAYLEKDRALLILDQGEYREVEFIYEDECEVYRKKAAIPEYEVPTDLAGVFGDKLSSVKLPEGFEWEDPDIVLNEMGEHTYKATFTPSNPVGYETVKGIEIKVNVNKKRVEVQMPETFYALKYEEGVSLGSVELPEGWEFADPGYVLQIGPNVVQAVFKGDQEHFEYTDSVEPKSITINLEKGVHKIPPVSLTVESGTQLMNHLLPKVDGGKLLWDVAQVVTASGKYTCHFVPYDVNHYLEQEGIEVDVNVTANSNPVTPDTPIDPDTPDTPVDPDTPTVPDTPQNPDTPGGSGKPMNPQPSRPQNPTTPQRPSSSQGSTNTSGSNGGNSDDSQKVVSTGKSHASGLGLTSSSSKSQGSIEIENITSADIRLAGNQAGPLTTKVVPVKVTTKSKTVSTAESTTQDNKVNGDSDEDKEEKDKQIAKSEFTNGSSGTGTSNNHYGTNSSTGGSSSSPYKMAGNEASQSNNHNKMYLVIAGVGAAFVGFIGFQSVKAKKKSSLKHAANTHQNTTV